MGTLKEGTQGQHEQRAVGVIRDRKVGMVRSRGIGGSGRRWEGDSTRTQVLVWAALLEVWAMSICSWRS